MQPLDHYLRECFPEGRTGMQGWAAVNESHAVHVSGYDVSYSRYSVTYRDARGELVLAAELDDNGVLIVYSLHCANRAAVVRIGEALRFLDVPHAHR